jgi:DEAD/DEAH box helicase domain-containing protein
LQHIPCAAYELPLSPKEVFFESEVYSHALTALKEDNTLKPYKEFLRYAIDDYPAKGVNLRGLTDYNIQIINNGIVIGETDPIGAMGSLYKSAIYQHLGTKYMSVELDLEKKFCNVEKVDVDYYTEAVWETMVDMIETEETKSLSNANLIYGYIKVTREPKLFKKIKERTYENIGYGPITLMPFTYETTGFSISLAEKWVLQIQNIDKRYIDVAIYSLSYILKNSSPSICMGDRGDIHTDVALTENEEKWNSCLYLYDALEGGIGFSEKIFNRIQDALSLALQIIEECECIAGCPSCVPPLPPGIKSQDIEELLYESNGAVECAKSLLNYYLNEKFYTPNIKTFTLNIDKPPIVKEDPEIQKLQNRLKRSAEILKKKREKKY